MLSGMMGRQSFGCVYVNCFEAEVKLRVSLGVGLGGGGGCTNVYQGTLLL